MNKKSLINAFLLDGKGGGKPISWQEIENWQPEQGVLWIHLDYTAKRTEKWLRSKSGLDKIVVSALLRDESRPRCLISKEGVMTCLRGVNLNTNQDPEDMVSVRTWIDRNRIITTRRRKLFSIQEIVANVQDGSGPKNPSDFLRTLIEHLTHHITDIVEVIEENVDLLEENVTVAESRLLRPKLADARCQLVQFRRYLAPQREALNRLLVDKNDLIDQMDRQYIRESADHIILAIEDLDSSRERASVSQEELTSRIQEQMDRRMLMLSITAVIFLPLSFLTGLLGINVGGIPGSDNKWAFLSVCVIMLVIAIILIGLLRRKKWL